MSKFLPVLTGLIAVIITAVSGLTDFLPTFIAPLAMVIYLLYIMYMNRG